MGDLMKKNLKMVGITATMMSSLSGSIQRSLAAPSGFSQNRVFAGLGWTFNQNFRAEGGYLNQYLNSGTSANNIMHHLILGSLFINF